MKDRSLIDPSISQLNKVALPNVLHGLSNTYFIFATKPMMNDSSKGHTEMHDIYIYIYIYIYTYKFTSE